MKFSMKKSVFAACLGLALGSGMSVTKADTLVLTFTDSGAATALAGACSDIAWTAGADFRMCSTDGISLGGGFPVQKNAINGGETYTFDTTSGMTAVTGTTTNPGAAFAGSAAPTAGTNVTWQQNAYFFGIPFNFLAPVTGTLAGTAYGTATYVGPNPPANGTLVQFIKAPVLEAQWGNTWFPLGQASGGITFYATITSAVTAAGVTTFNFEMFANELIDVAEDPGAAGFSNWTAQWHMRGSGVYTDTTAPSVVTTSPADGATGVGTNTSKYEVTYSEPMDDSTVVSGSISISGGVTVGSPTASNNNTIFSFPITSGALAGSTTYTVTLDSSPEDVAGNNTIPTTRTFTTAAAGDTTAPTISTRSPSDGATDASITTTVTVTFSEAMSPTTAGSITVVKTSDSSSVAGTVTTSDNTTFTFTPTSSLSYSTQYTVTVAAATAEDAVGNNLAADSPWSFTTASTAATTSLAPLKTDPLGSGCAINPRAKFDPGLLAMLLGSFGWLAWRRRRSH